MLTLEKTNNILVKVEFQILIKLLNELEFYLNVKFPAEQTRRPRSTEPAPVRSIHRSLLNVVLRAC